jgi:nitrate reductase NapAB chaperone NapD
MVVASGFIEVAKLSEMEQIINEVRMRKIEINEINNDKIVFLIERETMDKVKKDFEPLKDINGVKNVHLAYFSIEGADEENAEMSKA